MKSPYYITPEDIGRLSKDCLASPYKLLTSFRGFGVTMATCEKLVKDFAAGKLDNCWKK